MRAIRGHDARAGVSDDQRRDGQAEARVFVKPDRGSGSPPGTSDSELLSEIYLNAVCREPTSAEQTAVCAHIAGARDRRTGWEDVVWALLNSKEFLLRH